MRTVYRQKLFIDTILPHAEVQELPSTSKSPLSDVAGHEQIVVDQYHQGFAYSTQLARSTRNFVGIGEWQVIFGYCRGLVSRFESRKRFQEIVWKSVSVNFSFAR